VSVLSRCLVAIVGLLLLSFSSLLNDAEEKRIQNWIVDLWAETGERGSRYLSKQAIFLRYSSRVSAELLNRVFGARKMSFFALRACVILSFASQLLSLAISSPIDAYLYTFSISFSESRMTPQAALFMGYFGAVLALLTILIGIVPTLIRRWYASLFATIMATGLFILTVAAEIRFTDEVGLAIWSTLAGLALDMIFILCLTRLLERLQHTDNAWLVVIGAFSSVLVAFVLAIPFLAGVHSILLDYEVPAISHGDFTGAVTKLVPVDLFYVSVMLTLNFFCSCLIFGLMAFGAMHKLFWPVLSRLLDSAYSKRWLTSNAKWLSRIGFALIAYAFWGGRSLADLTRGLLGAK